MPGLLVDVPSDADPTRLGQLLKPCGEVDALAEDIAFLADHVAKANADPKANALRGGPSLLVLEHGLLHFDRGLHRFRSARKLDQGAVAHQLDDPAAMAGNDRLDHLLAQRLEAGQRTGLVLLDQARIADNVGCDDGGEPALHAGSGHAMPSRRLWYLLYEMSQAVRLPSNNDCPAECDLQ